jgi:predicted metal-binding membrane protein
MISNFPAIMRCKAPSSSTVETVTDRWRGLAVLPFPPLALSLAGSAWVMLLGLDASPYGRYLHHGDWGAVGLGAAICAAVPGGTWLAPLMAYATGWLLMTGAMMLPTTLPLTRIFGRMVAGRSDGAVLQGLLIMGYLVAWSGFGVSAYALDWALHAGLSGWTWLSRHPGIPGAMVLAVAGGFQFSGLKYHCLDKCRTPLGFIMSRWHGPKPRREAFWLGLSHGGYCVGCCWALMLVMFFVGMGNLGWMLGVGLVMAVEKNHSWGRRIAAPLGGALLSLAGIVLLRDLV